MARGVTREKYPGSADQTTYLTTQNPREMDLTFLPAIPYKSLLLSIPIRWTSYVNTLEVESVFGTFQVPCDKNMPPFGENEPCKIAQDKYYG